jgi:MoaA/NifB/PqqE/SkfB family radical SAM enzyme
VPLTLPNQSRRTVAETLAADQPTRQRQVASPSAAPYPQTLVLDWTDYCNAKCFFCQRAKYEETIGGKGEFIPFEKLRKLERVLSRIKFFGISSAIGEPLLHPELEEILRWLYEINPAILIRTTTNGTPLTASKAPLFAKHISTPFRTGFRAASSASISFLSFPVI